MSLALRLFLIFGLVLSAKAAQLTTTYNDNTFVMTPTNLLYSNIVAGTGFTVSKGTGSRITLTPTVTPAVLTTTSNDIIAFAATGTRTNLIVRKTGTNNAVTIYGTWSDVFLVAAHSSIIASLQADSSGRSDLLLNDETGATIARIGGRNGNQFLTANGSMLGIGGQTNPQHALDVNGAVSSTLVASNRLVMTTPTGNVLTNMEYSPDNLRSNFVDAFAISNRIRGDYVVSTIATNGSIDLNVPKQYITLTNNSYLGFVNTNGGNSTIAYLFNNGYSVDFTGVHSWDNGLPNDALPTTWTGTNLFMFISQNGVIHATWTGPPNNAAFVASSAGFSSNQTLYTPKIPTGAADGLVATAADSDGNIVWEAPAAGSGEANTMSSAGGISLVNPKTGVDLPIKGLSATQFGTNSTQAAIISGAPLTNIIHQGPFTLDSGGPKLINQGGVVTSSNAANTFNASMVIASLTLSEGVLAVPATAGQIEAAGEEVLKFDSTNGIALPFNVTYYQGTEAAVGSGVTNWVVDFQTSEWTIPSSALTNYMWIMHCTNFAPANQVRYTTWDINTGITNRHVILCTELTNRIYGTNMLQAVTEFLLPSNSLYSIPFRSTGGNDTFSMGFPQRIAP